MPTPEIPAAPQPPTRSDHTLSVVVPLYNEVENVAPLVEDICQALSGYPRPWELILVDDGSSDGTTDRLLELARRPEMADRLRVLVLQRNFGQTAAMQAGIDAAVGSVIGTMDGDLQNDPTDIPRMVERLLDEDLDLLQGWRRHRKDDLLLRKVPSRIANRLIGRVTGVRLHDYGCSLKVYRASVIKAVRLFGEMHRFIPAWVSLTTSPARIQEHVVNHRPRLAGASKYGLARTYRVLLDLLAVYFFLRFLAKPGHFFGRFGLLFGVAGGGILAYLAGLKLFLGEHIGQRPLLLAGVLLFLVGVQFLTTGVLSELAARTYFAASGGTSYVVRVDTRPNAALNDAAGA